MHLDGWRYQQGMVAAKSVNVMESVFKVEVDINQKEIDFIPQFN